MPKKKTPNAATVAEFVRGWYPDGAPIGSELQSLARREIVFGALSSGDAGADSAMFVGPVARDALESTIEGMFPAGDHLSQRYNKPLEYEGGTGVAGGLPPAATAPTAMLNETDPELAAAFLADEKTAANEAAAREYVAANPKEAAMLIERALAPGDAAARRTAREAAMTPQEVRAEVDALPTDLAGAPPEAMQTDISPAAQEMLAGDIHQALGKAGIGPENAPAPAPAPATSGTEHLTSKEREDLAARGFSPAAIARIDTGMGAANRERDAKTGQVDWDSEHELQYQLQKRRIGGATNQQQVDRELGRSSGDSLQGSKLRRIAIKERQNIATEEELEERIWAEMKASGGHVSEEKMMLLLSDRFAAQHERRMKEITQRGDKGEFRSKADAIDYYARKHPGSPSMEALAFAREKLESPEERRYRVQREEKSRIADEAGRRVRAALAARQKAEGAAAGKEPPSEKSRGTGNRPGSYTQRLKELQESQIAKNRSEGKAATLKAKAATEQSRGEYLDRADKTVVQRASRDPEYAKLETERLGVDATNRRLVADVLQYGLSGMFERDSRFPGWVELLRKTGAKSIADVIDFVNKRHSSTTDMRRAALASALARAMGFAKGR